MQALGLIETKGTLAAIEAADVMLKAAEIELIEKQRVGGGLITILISGDVAAVQTAVAAAQSAVERLGNNLMLTAHVIPRPDGSIDGLIQPRRPERNLEKVDSVVTEMPVIEETEEIVKISDENQEEIITILETEMAFKQGERLKRIELEAVKESKDAHELLAYLKQLKASQIRELANEYPEFKWGKKELSKATKAQIIKRLSDFYRLDAE